MKKIFLLSMSLALTAPAAFAASGKTADGCTYQVVNGQYLTNCGKNKAADQVAAVAAAPAQEAAPATNYASVPMRYEPSAPHPVVLQSSLEQEAPRTTTKIRSLDREEDWQEARAHQHQDLLDATYVSAMIGASTMTSVSAGSALGVGVNVGSNIDDTFGFQLGYAYSSQDLNLHLDSRGSADPTPVYSGSPYGQNNDATLRAHLLTGEIQAHLTDSYKRLRPYLGAGLGWKSSTVEENSLGTNYGNAVSGGSLSQSSLGGIGAAGVKFRVARALNFDASFRYFFPILRQDSKIEEPGSNYGGYGVYPTATRLTKADDALTGSGQYQIVGGLQYLF